MNALEAAAMAAANTGRGHRRKERIPPGTAARPPPPNSANETPTRAGLPRIIHHTNRFPRHRPVDLRAGRPAEDPPVYRQRHFPDPAGTAEAAAAINASARTWRC